MVTHSEVRAPGGHPPDHHPRDRGQVVTHSDGPRGATYLHPRDRGLSSFSQDTVTGRLGSDLTLQSKRAVEPLKADWCSSPRTMRVGSGVCVKVGGSVTHTPDGE